MGKRKRRIRVWMIIAAALAATGVLLFVQFSIDSRRAYERLKQYPVQTVSSAFGKMSYAEEGAGPAVLLSHGIFGGYDQGLVSLNGAVGEGYRRISPSRFGYPGSDLPEDPTPENQAKAFLELLDHLGIRKAVILTTSAGGAPGIRFAIDYPNRVSGLILLSSGVPAEKKTREQAGYLGPPAPLLNDFVMWLSVRYFGFAFHSMMGSDVGPDFYDTMLPAAPRSAGVVNDAKVTNPDMLVHYDDYPVEKIAAPILVVSAEDDPMVKFSDTQKFIARVHPQTAVFKTGGHLITGHGGAVRKDIRAFLQRIALEQ